MGQIKLILRQFKDTNKAIVILRSPEGQVADHQFTLPWLEEKEWNAIFQYLTAFKKYKDTWPEDPIAIEIAKKLGLASDDGAPLSSRIEKIGKLLYKTIFGNEKIRHLFRQSLDRYKNQTPIIVLHFVDAGRYLQTYPWELLHDGDNFLFDSKRASLVRWIDFGQPTQSLQLYDELNVLPVDPRPTMPDKYAELPNLDRDVLEKHLSDVSSNVIFRDLESTSFNVSTLNKIIDTISSKEIHVIHIDAHGDFGWLCEGCSSLNPHEATYCQREGCGKLIPTDQHVQGYLAFQNPDDNLTWISGEQLGKAIAKSNIKLVVLSACNSGLVGGGTVFNSVAGALIKQGVPAVVAMQLPVDIESTKMFVYHFYKALFNCKPLVEAIAIAKTSLLEFEDAWYRPTLYLRSDEVNIEGKIFELEASSSASVLSIAQQQNLDYKYDVFLSYDEGVERWVNELFLVSFKRCLLDKFGKSLRIFQNKQTESTGEPWPLSLKNALAYSRFLITLWSPGYFNKQWWRYEYSMISHREKQKELRTPGKQLVLMVPIIVCDGQNFPEDVRGRLPRFEFNNFVVPEEFVKAFKDSPRCIDFHNEMKEKTKQIVEYMKLAPPWNKDFLNDSITIIPETTKKSQFRFSDWW